MFMAFDGLTRRCSGLVGKTIRMLAYEEFKQLSTTGA